MPEVGSGFFLPWRFPYLFESSTFTALQHLEQHLELQHLALEHLALEHLALEHLASRQEVVDADPLLRHSVRRFQQPLCQSRKL